MRTCTVGDLKLRTRERADAVGDTQWVTDAELLRYLDAGYTELVDLLTAADIHLFESHSDFTTDGTNDSYAVPLDMYKLLGIDYKWSAIPEKYVQVPVVTFGERNRYTSLFVSTLYGAYAAGYRLIGQEVKLYPLPPAGQVYRIQYSAVPAKLAHLADAWEASTAYLVDDEVVNGANIYICTQAGTSAGSGGPTGTGTGIVDGTVHWDFSIAYDDVAVDGIAGYDELLVVLAALRMAMKEGDSAGIAALREDRDRYVSRIAQMGVDRQPVQSICSEDEDGGYGLDRRYPYGRIRWRDA